MENKREVQFDILRLLATVAVIMTHVCGVEIHDLLVTSSNFVWLNCIRAAITWDVPIFVMISGRFFLDPEKPRPTKVIYGKYIKHLVIAFVIWSAIYTGYYMIFGYLSDGGLMSNIKGGLYQFLTGPYHMWYIFMIVGLYVATPILRRITTDKKVMEYFIILFIVSQFIVQYGVKLPYVNEVVRAYLDKTYFNIALGYSGYFVLGYYLYKYGVPKKIETPLYVTTIILIALSCVGTTAQSINEGVLNEFISTYQTPNIIVESCGIYLFFVNMKPQVKEKTQNLLATVGKLGLGIYLSHALVLVAVSKLGLYPTMITPLIGVIIMTIITFVLSTALVFIISKIPVLKKYMI